MGRCCLGKAKKETPRQRRTRERHSCQGDETDARNDYDSSCDGLSKRGHLKRRLTVELNGARADI
jgi:hypothetical protein